MANKLLTEFDFVYTDTAQDFKTVHVKLNITDDGKLEISIFSDEDINDDEVLHIAEELRKQRLKKLKLDNMAADSEILLCVGDEKRKVALQS